MKSLKENEAIIFRWIVAYKETHDGNSPSVREILRGTGVLSSTSSVLHCLRALQKKGWITTDHENGGHYRNIAIVGGMWSYKFSEEIA
ncbi:MAG: hypothetical protein KA314_04735 [Chloroflexi bacterium]|nr:hypothetical protein [Chloroflexota bacterium]